MSVEVMFDFCEPAERDSQTANVNKLEYQHEQLIPISIFAYGGGHVNWWQNKLYLIKGHNILLLCLHMTRIL